MITVYLLKHGNFQLPGYQQFLRHYITSVNITSGASTFEIGAARDSLLRNRSARVNGWHQPIAPVTQHCGCRVFVRQNRPSLPRKVCCSSQSQWNIPCQPTRHSPTQPQQTVAQRPSLPWHVTSYTLHVFLGVTAAGLTVMASRQWCSHLRWG